MVGTMFEDNQSPYLTLVEQGSAPGSASAGQRRLYVLSADHLVYLKDSAGSVVGLVTDQGAVGTYVDLAEQGGDPASPATGYERFYSKSTGLFVKNSAGVVTGPFGAGGGGLSASVLGYNAVGATSETATVYRWYCKQVTPAASGLLQSIGVYFTQAADALGSVAVAVFADNAGAVGDVLASSSVGVAKGPSNAPFLLEHNSTTWTARWLHLPCVYALTGSTAYWIGVMAAWDTAGTQPTFKYDGSGTDRYFTAGGYRVQDGAVSAQTATTNKYSIRADYLS